MALEVLPIQVGGVAVAIPPGPVVEGSTVVLRVVIVKVFGGEFHAVVFQEGVTCRSKKGLSRVPWRRL